MASRRPSPQRLARELIGYEGAERATDEQLLAALLGEEVDLSSTGGVKNLLWTGLGELAALPGVGLARAIQIKAAIELGRRARLPSFLGTQIHCAQDLADLLVPDLGDLEQEVLVVLGLDARHRIVCRHTATVGQVDRLVVSLADIFRPLIRRACAACVIAHNHPSGEPGPSSTDERLTLRVAEAGDLMGIPLLDHVIVGRGGHYSFAEAGGLASRPRAPRIGCLTP